MTTYELALLLHLLGVLALVSGVVLAGIASGAARGRDDPGEIALLLGIARAGALLVGAGSVAVLVFGIWLVDESGWGWDTGWIRWALALYVAALVLGGLGGQAPKRARLLATRLAAEGAPATPELRTLLTDRGAAIANWASAASMLAILVLMVIKP